MIKAFMSPQNALIIDKTVRTAIVQVASDELSSVVDAFSLKVSMNRYELCKEGPLFAIG